MSLPSQGAQGPIGKQIVLPWSKAMEIAGKSIRVRFWRSMITMSSIVLAIAFLMSIWTSTAITSSLAVGPQVSIDAVKEDVRIVYPTLLTERIAHVRRALDRAPGAPSADEVKKLKERLGKPLDQAKKAADKAIAGKELALAKAEGDERKRLQDEIDALKTLRKPENDLRLLLNHLEAERRDLEQTAGPPPSREEIQRRYAYEIRRALRWKRWQVREKTRAKRGQSKDEQDKLQKEIDGLEELARRENRIEFLHSHLLRERSRLESMKGDVDAELQREGAAQVAAEEEAGAKRKHVQAAVGGNPFDFIGQMTPTDTWLAILALLVCLVGIANAMFMTVQERFREIGTMKCLGALDGFIVKLFLLESSALGFIGTLAGIGVGLLLSSGRQLWRYGWPTLRYYPGVNLLVAAALAAVVGLILSIGAAIFPAQKAARMEPVEAMRVEE